MHTMKELQLLEDELPKTPYGVFAPRSHWELLFPDPRLWMLLHADCEIDKRASEFANIVCFWLFRIFDEQVTKVTFV